MTLFQNMGAAGRFRFYLETWPIHPVTRLICPIFTDSLEGIISGIRLDAVRLEAETTRPRHMLSKWKPRFFS